MSENKKQRGNRGNLLSINEQIEKFHIIVEDSYANNSRLYAHFAESADLATITTFLNWDAKQPAFYVYLRQWLPKAPEHVKQALVEHIDVEVNEEHSRLFKEMLNHLNSKTKAEAKIDEKELEKLNYTFSEACANKENFGFFLGGFFATEIMSAKRCHQLTLGLKRAGIADKHLHYLNIHTGADSAHGDEVGEIMIAPFLARQPEMAASVENGIRDRLSRSGEYLKWYERTQLQISAQRKAA